jgi:hypothetical protein
VRPDGFHPTKPLLRNLTTTVRKLHLLEHTPRRIHFSAKMGSTESTCPGERQIRADDNHFQDLSFDLQEVKAVVQQSSSLPHEQTIEESYFAPTPIDINQDILRDCMILCSAVYHTNPTVELKSHNRRLTSVLEPNLDQNDGRFILAEFSTASETIVYVAIRGSQIPSDWNTNAQFLTTYTGNGFVHSGWYGRSTHLPVNYLLGRLNENERNNNLQVVITGHSLGGAVAQLVTNSLLLRLTHHPELKQLVKCVTFAAPTTMTGLLAEQTNQYHRENFLNFVNSLDPVPKLLSWCHSFLVKGSNLVKDHKTNKVTDAINATVELNFGLNQPRTNETPTTLISATFLDVLKGLVGFGLSFLADIISYEHVGYYFLTSNPFIPLSQRGMKELLDFSTFRISPDLVTAHSMAKYSIDLSNHLYLLHTQTQSQQILLRPFPIPKVKVDYITLLPQVGIDTVRIDIFGEHLSSVKQISSTQTQLCKIENHTIHIQDCLNSKHLSFNCKISKIMSRPKTMISLSVTQFLHSTPLYFTVPIHYKDYHPFDDCPLRESLITALLISTFSDSTGLKVDHLRRLIQAIFDTTPVAALFTPRVFPFMFSNMTDELKGVIISSSFLQEKVISLIATLNVQQRQIGNVGREQEKLLPRQGQSFFTSQNWIDLKLFAEKFPRHKRKHSDSAETLMTITGFFGSGDKWISIATSKKMMDLGESHANLQGDDFEAFIRPILSDFLIEWSDAMSEAIGLYHSPPVGNISNALSLRTLLPGLNLSHTLSSESLARELQTMYGLTEFDDIQNIAGLCQPANDLAAGRKVKLLLLASAMGKLLKELPIVVLSGSHSGGKSTLRDILLGIDNSSPMAMVDSGGDRYHLPNIKICGKDFSTYCVLDNFIETRGASVIFDQIATAKIIVVPYYYACDQAKLTSKTCLSPFKAHCPIMTCFNMADLLIPENPAGWEDSLEDEAKCRRVIEEPFDLTRASDCHAFPRVWTVFNSQSIESLPVVDKTILLTPTEIHNWILSVCYPCAT